MEETLSCVQEPQLKKNKQLSCEGSRDQMKPMIPPTRCRVQEKEDHCLCLTTLAPKVRVLLEGPGLQSFARRRSGSLATGKKGKKQ